MNDKQRYAAHPKQKLADGSGATSVTTALGILAKPALVPWANKLGLQGIDSSKYVDSKARIGTLAHALILADLKGIEPDPREFTAVEMDQAENAFLKWLTWRKLHVIEPILVEEGLVSEVHRYGGIIDFYGMVDGVPTLLDFKTGKAIYDEMSYQVAAYRAMLEEAGHPVIEVRILQIGRDETEAFSEKSWKNTSKQLSIFLHCLSIYNLKKELKGE
jgi:hypothetical protein